MKSDDPESSELEQELQRLEADDRDIEKLQGYKRQRRAKLVLLIGLAVAVIGGVGGWGVFEMVAVLAAVLAAGLFPFLRVRRPALEPRKGRVLNSGADDKSGPPDAPASAT